MTSSDIAQIFGLLYVILDFLSPRQKTRNKSLIVNGASNISAIVEYHLLGGINGVVCCLIAFARNLVFSRFKKTPLWLIITYIIIAISANIFFVKKYVDVLPIINIILVAFALSEENIIKLRTFWLITCFFALPYDIYYGAKVSYIFGIINIITISYFLYNEKIKKNKKKKA